jgi:prevent-host-death family protein
VGKSLGVSEARRQFSRLVTRVSREGVTVTITHHGREQAALIGIRDYQELSQKARAFERSRKRTKPFTLKGSLEMRCSPVDLVEEMNRIRTGWAESVHRSSTELAQEIARR